MVIYNRVDEKISNGTNAFTLLAAIAGVDDIGNDAEETDAHEYTNDKTDNAYKDRSVGEDGAVDNVETESDYTNNRNKNIGPDGNDEATILGEIATKIEAEKAKE